MAKDSKGVVHKDNVDRRSFSYTLDNVNLAFTLRTDVKSELKAFKAMMEKHAIPDIQEALDKLN